MRLHKCDRCGAIIEDHKKDKNIFDTIKSITTYEITYEITKYVDGVLESYLDLCEKCHNDLKEWLNVPTEDIGGNT